MTQHGPTNKEKARNFSSPSAQKEAQTTGKAESHAGPMDPPPARARWWIIYLPLFKIRANNHSLWIYFKPQLLLSFPTFFIPRRHHLRTTDRCLRAARRAPCRRLPTEPRNRPPLARRRTPSSPKKKVPSTLEKNTLFNILILVFLTYRVSNFNILFLHFQHFENQVEPV